MPRWLLEKQMKNLEEGDDEFEEYKKEVKNFEKTDDGAEYSTEWNYWRDESTDSDEITRTYGQLCVELKFLYVAITRPKKRLFIYDNDEEARKPIETIWKNIDAIEKVTDKDINAMSLQEDLKLTKFSLGGRLS